MLTPTPCQTTQHNTTPHTDESPNTITVSTLCHCTPLLTIPTPPTLSHARATSSSLRVFSPSRSLRSNSWRSFCRLASC